MPDWWLNISPSDREKLRRFYIFLNERFTGSKWALWPERQRVTLWRYTPATWMEGGLQPGIGSYSHVAQVRYETLRMMKSWQLYAPVSQRKWRLIDQTSALEVLLYEIVAVLASNETAAERRKSLPVKNLA